MSIRASSTRYPVDPPPEKAAGSVAPGVSAATTEDVETLIEQEVFRARVFPEPLVAAGPTSDQEDRALAAAVARYGAAQNPWDVAPFEAFLRAYPESSWRASVLANTAVIYRQQGYFTRALGAWHEAFRLAKDQPGRRAAAVADFAIGEALSLAADLGQASLVEAGLREMGDREPRGPSASRVKRARLTLAHLRRFPGSVMPSGPTALEVLYRLDRGQSGLLPAAIRAYQPTADGMSLTALDAMADAIGLPGVAVLRGTATRFAVPSIVHLRIGHFSAVIDEDPATGRYLLRDPALGGLVWMPAGAVNDEASGYAWIPGREVPPGWSAVSTEEGTAVIGRSCVPGPPNINAPPCETGCCEGGGGSVAGGSGGGSGCGSTCGARGAAIYRFNPVDASLLIRDTPLFYTPPRGPAVELSLAYKSREVLLPQIPAFGNLGPNWAFSWLSYAEEWPSTVGTYGGINPEYVSLLLRGGGQEKYIGPPGSDGAYPRNFRKAAQLVRVSVSPIRYERRLNDGSMEVFAQPDGAPAGQWRRVFLTEVIDPQGQRLQFTYDAQLRLVAVTDAVGQVTTLAYGDAADPLRVTTVTDPFGRSAQLTYTGSGQLASIADMAGLVSSFTYGSSDFIVALKTPYGTTTFRHESDPTAAVWYPFIEATDALGGTERLEFRWEDAALPANEPAAAVPSGFATYNTDLHKYNTLYWDTRAWARGPGDVTTATITHWLQSETYPDSMIWQSDPTPHSVKRPFENRVWYAYPGQPTPIEVGTLATASVTSRVLDDGTTQATTSTYNAQGQVLTHTDPVGRQTRYSYAPNGIDLLEVRQTSPGVNDLLTSYANYNALHQPGSVTDAAGQTTTYTYNPGGQVLTVTTPARSGISENRTTTYTYDAEGRLEAVTRPAEGAITSYTYDSFGRVRTVTDEDGYTITTEYDGLNRPTRVTYPDGTSEETTYDRLHVATRRDRLGRLTRYTADALGRLIATRDPAGRLIVQEWDGNALRRLTDANGHATTWDRDAAGRVMREIRADGLTATTYTYEATTSRVKTVTDPKQQVTTYTYNPDDTAASTVYTNAEVPTPAVSFTYDPAYHRVATMVDGTGTTTYTYHPVGQLGAGQVATVDGPLTNDVISYSYDELGRVVTRAIDGVPLTLAYDALGRAEREVNALGTFTYTYDGVTGRLATVAYPNGPAFAKATAGLAVARAVPSASGGGQTSTYSYLSTLQDHRLETIHHQYPNGATLSRFDYTYDVGGNILTWRQQADSTAVLWEYGYDEVDQLTAAIKKATDPPGTILQRDYYQYDPAGNRLSEQIDDQITSWTYDSLNRLVTQTPGGRLKIRGQLNEAGTVTVNGQPALVSAANLFDGYAPVGMGTTAFTIAAADLAGNITTQQYEVDTAGAAKVFTFDANGNLTADGTRTFEWDARNQLVAVTVGTHRSEFTYDGKQRRVRAVEKDGGVTQSDTRVLWCEKEICEERAADGITVTRRSFALGEQVAGASRYFTADHLGSIGEVTDTSNTLLARYAFDPWGRRAVAAGADVTPVGFTGHRWHSSSELWLTQHRQLDSGMGRWTREDPLGFEDGVNLYQYVHNSPVNYVDPSGLQTLTWPTVGKLCIDVGRASAGVLGAAIGMVLTQCGDGCQEKNKDCPPCDPPVGTVGYRLDRVPPSKPHFPFKGDHVHLYIRRQNPKTCECYWNKWMVTEPPPPPGAVAMG